MCFQRCYYRALAPQSSDLAEARASHTHLVVYAPPSQKSNFCLVSEPQSV